MGFWTLYFTKPHINKATGGHLLIKTKGSLHIVGILEMKHRGKTKSEFMSRKEGKKYRGRWKLKNIFFLFNGVTLRTKFYQMVFYIFYLLLGNDVVRWHG